MIKVAEEKLRNKKWPIGFFFLILITNNQSNQRHA
jgi:hypothetical protein